MIFYYRFIYLLFLFMKAKAKLLNNLWYINYKHIILFLLVAYVSWLITIFFKSVVEIDTMYSDSFDKRLDEKQKIEKLIDSKQNRYWDDLEYKISIDNIIK